MLSTDKHYEMLSHNVRHTSAGMYDSFKLFIQMFSGVVGGSVLLRTQATLPSLRASIADLSVVLAAMIVIAVAVMLIDQYRLWFGYRRALSKVAGIDEGGNSIAEPDPVTSRITLAVMIISMVFSLVGFIIFNPLRIPD
jgi:hypothetical protein